MVSKQEQTRARVYQFYMDNRSKGKKFTADHFLAEKIPKTTIYRVIDRAENDFGYARVPGSGRTAEIMTRSTIKDLSKMFDHKCNISQSQAASKFECSQQHVSKTLAKKTLIRPRKKIKIPKRSDKQIAAARPKCIRLLRTFAKRKWILDDESYFTLSHSSIAGNDLFYTSNIKKTPASVKFSPIQKFQKKLMVWICFSEDGISQPYIMPSGLAVNQKVYLNECIKKRLMPFIAKHHSDNNYVFWPDQASSHYAKTVTAYFKEKNVQFVAKKDNPANLPECRPIEDFWSILKSLVYKNGWQAKNVDQLRTRIKNCIKKVAPAVVQRLARDTPKRLDLVRRKGVIENR